MQMVNFMDVKSDELKQRRETLGLSREELARELKTTYTTVYRWEIGNREIPPYLELALETIERRQKESRKK
jgi:DNA-binding transcriptional regulator YiaG